VNVEDVQRYARQIALPEIGVDGQERLAAARVAVLGDDRAAQVAAQYLSAAGVGTILPDLDGAELVVRSGFDDDAVLGMTKRLGIPAVFVRSQPDMVDLISFPARAPDPDAPLDLPATTATRPHDGAAAVVAGTLAASEAIQVLLGRGPRARARLLRLPLDGRPPQGQEIPWPSQ
jgi:molybdopterin-synthase adenylyltransferase